LEVLNMPLRSIPESEKPAPADTFAFTFPEGNFADWLDRSNLNKHGLRTLEHVLNRQLNNKAR
jgi:hypothetical protein